MIEILPGLALPDEAVSYVFSRSGGPGGQHVNKVSSRATLLFDVAHSPALDDDQRARILARLATRISKDGVLRVVAQSSRSQAPTATRRASASSSSCDGRWPRLRRASRPAYRAVRRCGAGRRRCAAGT